MLTHNSEKNLARALASVADFAEIIIADGGSTDATVGVARAAGARVIQQSNPGRPISDFARERNLTLSAATQPWFFYLDSDELMSPELIEFIRAIATKPAYRYGAYRVRYLKTNTDASKIYRTYREYYQVRLVRTNIGACFEQPVHEHIWVPTSVLIGQTEAPWYVPLDADDLSFRAFTKKAWKRVGIQAARWQPTGVRDVFYKLVRGPIILVSKSLYKMVMVKIRYGQDAIPARYELLRLFYALFIFLQHTRRLVRGRVV